MIYLILMYNFDNLETNSSLARYSTVLGYANTKKEAQEHIENSKKIDKEFHFNYRGWDHSIYPQYEIKKVPQILQKRKRT